MKSIWYKNPAENFGEAISVGNGRIGATVFGGTGHEKIYLNEESVWSCRYSDRNNKNAKEAVTGIMAVRHQGRELEATELNCSCVTGDHSSQEN